MVTGWKNLTQKERKHLNESNIHTNDDMQIQVKFLLATVQTSPMKKPACWECWFIAKKLGLINQDA